MAARTIGASIRAVIMRRPSTVSLRFPSDPAAASGTGRERGDGVVELLGGEVRPERLRDIELGVGDLPQEEVRDPHLPARADHEIHLWYLWRVEIRGEGGLVHLLGLETVLDHAPGSVHYLRPPA